MLTLKNIFAFILCGCLLNTQVLPAYTFVSQDQDNVRVAFVGIHYDAVAQDQQDNIETRISVLFDQEPSLYTISEKEIQDQLHTSLRQDIKEHLRTDEFRSAAELLDVDYIFAGKIENQSKSKETSALTGTLVRYDVSTDNLYNLRIKTFFEDFNEELVRFNNQLVQSIVPEQDESFLKQYLPGFLIAAATVVAVTILLQKTDGQSSGDGGVPTPPFEGY